MTLDSMSWIGFFTIAVSVVIQKILYSECRPFVLNKNISDACTLLNMIFLSNLKFKEIFFRMKDENMHNFIFMSFAQLHVLMAARVVIDVFQLIL